MTDTSRAPDWRRAEDYEYIDALERDERRWEFLRRSREYRAAHAQGRLSNPTIARMRFGIVGEAPAPSVRGDELPPEFRFANYGETRGKHPDFWQTERTANEALTDSLLGARLPEKTKKAKRAAENIPSVSEGLWAYDLELSVDEQVAAFESHLLRLRAKLAELQAIELQAQDAAAALAVTVGTPASPFDGLFVATQTGEEDVLRMWKQGTEPSDDSPGMSAEEFRSRWNLLSMVERDPETENLILAVALGPEKKPTGQAPARLLQVLDAVTARRPEVAEALLNGRAGSKSKARRGTDDALIVAGAVRREAAEARREIADVLFRGRDSNTSTGIKDARLAATAASKTWP